MQYAAMQPHHHSLVMNAEAKADNTRLLLNDLHALEALIVEDRMEKGLARIGYELELNFVDRDCAPACSCSVLLTGIIPTLDKSHITPEALTPEPRYQALYEIRRALKGDQYEYRIAGIDELLTRDNIALFAGSITSFQAHLQIATADTVDMYNWAQLLAAPTLAIAANSPLFPDKRLWHETRIALFEQATDTRMPDSAEPRNRPRVLFGDRWLAVSVLELLREDIIELEPLFRVNGAVEDALEALQQGRAVQDMVANAAFWAGAMAGLPRRYRGVQQRLDFALPETGTLKADALMDSCPVRISPDTPLPKALQLMLDKALSFLPVVSNKRIVGLLTEHDFVRVAQMLVGGGEGTPDTNSTDPADAANGGRNVVEG
ncbi:MAG: hypothetical protein RLZZ227_1989 [Pseudomonadota bacterium]|jgi:CBS domain-containing protein